MNTKVAILGAGCSHAYGYPLAAQVKEHLIDFTKSSESAAPKLHRLTLNTLNLFEKVAAQGCPAQTLDDLAWLIDQHKLSKEYYAREENLISEAKVAVSAMFLSKERAACATGLTGYRSLLRRIFGNPRYLQPALVESPWRVLSFNYDRLFELAVQQHFRVDLTESFYGPTLLNSGLSLGLACKVSVDTGRFAFLKLHGSAGFLGVNEDGLCNHYHSIPNPAKAPVIKDEAFFFGERADVFSNRPMPSLIVFPHEKNHLKSYPKNTLPFRFYVPEIWGAAQTVMSQAEEIQIIGYSVPEADGEMFGELLRHAEKCKKILVKDPDPGRVCERLRELNPLFDGELRPVETKFE